MTPYNPLPPAVSGPLAWLRAARQLREHGALNNIMLHIQDPLQFGEDETRILTAVDGLLGRHGHYSIQTVANTIFPASLRRDDDRKAFYDRYLKNFRRQKSLTGDWGRYFHRMIAWPASKGGRVNQLEELIGQLNEHGPNGDPKRRRYNMYEISLYSPELDRKKSTNRQCMSHIEIKPDSHGGEDKLHLTALYRNHYYVARALGNLVGLTALMQFIATETGLQVGTMTIVSTHAELDRGVGNARKKSTSWGVSGLDDLLNGLSDIEVADV